MYFPSLIMKFVQRDVKFYEDKVLQFSLERKLQIPPKEDLLAPKEEPWVVVE